MSSLATVLLLKISSNQKYFFVKAMGFSYLCMSLSAERLANEWLLCRKTPETQATNWSSLPVTSGTFLSKFCFCIHTVCIFAPSYSTRLSRKQMHTYPHSFSTLNLWEIQKLPPCNICQHCRSPKPPPSPLSRTVMSIALAHWKRSWGDKRQREEGHKLGSENRREAGRRGCLW